MIKNLKIRDLRVKIAFNLNRSKARVREANTPAIKSPNVHLTALGGLIAARRAEEKAGAALALGPKT